MSIPILRDVLKQSRTYLNDDNQAIWPDVKLMPKVRPAFNILQQELLLYDIPIMNSTSTIITVPALTADDTNQDLSSVGGYPTDIILPEEMKERALGQTNVDFIDMIETDYIPNVDKSTNLKYWCWYQQTILLRGATISNQVYLKYKRLLTLPGLNTDSTLVILGDVFLGQQIAAFASLSIKDYEHYNVMSAEAKSNLDKYVSINVKQQQNLPAKRRPYHRGKGSRVLRNW